MYMSVAIALFHFILKIDRPFTTRQHIKHTPYALSHMVRVTTAPNQIPPLQIVESQQKGI